MFGSNGKGFAGSNGQNGHNGAAGANGHQVGGGHTPLIGSATDGVGGCFSPVPVRVYSAGPRDFGPVSSVLSRHLRLIAVCFLAAVTGVSLAVFLTGNQYDAQMRILVKHERVDPLMTSEPNAARMALAGTVTEEEVNSEVALMRSYDLLRAVVVSCGLDRSPSKPWEQWFQGNESLEVRQATAIKRLATKLKIEPLKKSNLIEVTYSSDSPEISAQVLNKMAELYLAKHLVLNRPKGEYEFFRQQAEQYNAKLVNSEAKLAGFGQEHGAAAPQMERDLALKESMDLDDSLSQTHAAVAATTARMRALQEEFIKTPARLETQAKKSDNGQLLEQLKSTLLNLTLKRTELATKYEPTYRPLQEVNQQIEQTQAAIDAETARPLSENTTDQNPTYVWLQGEIAKVHSELPMLLAKAAITSRTLQEVRARVLALDAKTYQQQDLAREVKADEQNYLLYLQKQEEARISDALDERRISNVVLAQAPIVPVLPSQSRAMLLAIGSLVSLIFSLVCAFAKDYLDSAFRSPAPIEPIGESREIAVPADVITAPVSGLYPATSHPERELVI